MAMAQNGGGYDWASMMARMLAQRGASGQFPGSMASGAAPPAPAPPRQMGGAPAINLNVLAGMGAQQPTERALATGGSITPLAPNRPPGLVGNPKFNALLGGLGQFGAALAPDNPVAQSLGGLAANISQGNLTQIQRHQDQTDPNAPPVMGLDPQNALASWNLGQGERALADREKARLFEQQMMRDRAAMENQQFQQRMQWDAQTRAEDREFKLDDRMFEREFQNQQLAMQRANIEADNQRAMAQLGISQQQLDLARQQAQRAAAEPYAAGQWGAILPGPNGAPRFEQNPYYTSETAKPDYQVLYGPNGEGVRVELDTLQTAPIPGVQRPVDPMQAMMQTMMQQQFGMPGAAPAGTTPTKPTATQTPAGTWQLTPQTKPGQGRFATPDQARDYLKNKYGM